MRQWRRGKGEEWKREKVRDSRGRIQEQRSESTERRKRTWRGRVGGIRMKKEISARESAGRGERIEKGIGRVGAGNVVEPRRKGAE